MSTEIVQLTGGLYHFMVVGEAGLLRSRWSNGEALSTLRARGQELLVSFAEARERASERLGATVSEVCRSLRDLLTYLDESTPGRQEVREAWKSLAHNYETLRRTIRKGRLEVPEGVRLGHVKPRNLWRNAFHVSMGLMGITLYELVLTQPQIIAVGLALLGLFVFLDVMRRRSPQFNERLVGGVFGKISRPDEAHRIPAATWYLLALVVGVALLPARAIELGTLALALGDPAASLAGKKWGRLRLFRDRSLAGSVAFAVVTLAACFAFLALVMPELSLGSRLFAATIVALAGALTELFTVGLDDNLTIPLVAGVAAALVLSII